MIKLIATDIDGTLVKDGTLAIGPEYMEVVGNWLKRECSLWHVPGDSTGANANCLPLSQTGCYMFQMEAR